MATEEIRTTNLEPKGDFADVYMNKKKKAPKESRQLEGAASLEFSAEENSLRDILKKAKWI